VARAQPFEEEAAMQIGTEGEAARPREVWRRGLIMLLFAIAFSIGQVVLNAVTVVQFLWLLFAGVPNRFLRGFGASLSAWLAAVARFMTCASEEKPFPWQPWPNAD
jgi:hypothetical protein